MAKIRLTKNELKKQKDDLKRFTRYLPTLELKKQQLLVELRKIQSDIRDLTEESEKQDRAVEAWAGVFAEKGVDLQPLIRIAEVSLDSGNIAGIDIPLFRKITFEDAVYDYAETPLWIDTALDVCRKQIARAAEMAVLRQQEDVVSRELRVTIQRMKLFEEVKIPGAREAIRMIRIFLGDMQTAEVVRGKIAKTKILKKKEKVTAE
ncbi:V-type ATP synthase subunit D [bacterium]|nr:V-type ATP synthase subunit D [bacterium]